MSRQDSIVHESVATVGHDIVPYGRPLTPAHVLRRLPPDATPSQQDSAIQAVFTPGEVHYSNRPDTLHLPCHDAGRSIFDVSLPVYYEENYFSGDSLLHPEIKGGRHGVSGDPVPYTMRDDDIITGLLLLCFILVVVALSNSRRFIVRQLKDFLYVPHSGISAITETTSEVRFQFFLYYRRAFSSRFSSIFIPDTISEARLYSIPNTISSLFILPCSRAIFFSKACCICLSIRYFLITKRIYNG